MSGKKRRKMVSIVAGVLVLLLIVPFVVDIISGLMG